MKQNIVQTSNNNDNKESKPASKTKEQMVEEDFLKILLAFDFTRPAAKEVILSDISPENRDIFNLVTKNPKINLKDLSKQLEKKQNYVKIMALKGEKEYGDLSRQDLNLEAYAQARNLRHLNLETKKKKLSEQITEAEKSNNKALVRKLLQKYQNFINQE